MTTSTAAEGVIPARLSFLAIYNPSLAPRDETLAEQVVFCYSRRNRARLKRRKSTSTQNAADTQRNEQNEMLRQIGLAQGMVEFAKTFSNGHPVDSVETDKTRVVMLELESGWWVYASIDLTRLPRSALSTPTSQTPQFEYSAREVSPPMLLRQQLLHAHSIFLLHHGRCLDGLYEKLGREKFCNVLDGFWTRFARTWDVLLHGNPAVEALRGIKLAAGGELGMGVGEEEWGSGEREVLEGLVGRTDGLVDLMVSRFGGDSVRGAKMETKESGEGSNETDGQLASTDGVVFTGVGALTRKSARAVAGWVEWLHRYGVRAYGVEENPKSTVRRRRPRSRPKTEAVVGRMNGGGSLRQKAAPGLRAQGLQRKSLTTSQQHSSEMDERDKAANGGAPSSTSTRDSKGHHSISEKAAENTTAGGGGLKIMKYMTLGYGSSWGATSKTTELGSNSTGADDVRPADSNSSQMAGRAANRRGHSEGFFLIGLRGDLDERPEDDESNDDNLDASTMDSGQESGVDEQCHGRIMLRIVRVHLTNSDGHQTHSNDNRLRTLRVVVYQNPPFLYTFLFEPQTSSLALPSFYRSLHHLLGPLQTPLRSSTSLSRASERVPPSMAPYLRQNPPEEPDEGKRKKKVNEQQVYSVVFDPIDLTIHSSLPMIPDPSVSTLLAATKTGAGDMSGRGDASGKAWPRMDALNVHLQVLDLVASSRQLSWPGRDQTRPGKMAGSNQKKLQEVKDAEMTSRTTRGWWIALLHSPSPLSPPSDIDDAHHHHAGPNPPSSTLAPDDEDATSAAGSSQHATSTARAGPNKQDDEDKDEDGEDRQPSNQSIILVQRSLPLPSFYQNNIEDENTPLSFPSFWHRDRETTNPDFPAHLTNYKHPSNLSTPSRSANPRLGSRGDIEGINQVRGSGRWTASSLLVRPTLPGNIPLDLGLGGGVESSRRYLESLFK